MFARSSVESMITLKSPREIDIMSRAGRIVAATLARVREILRQFLRAGDEELERGELGRFHLAQIAAQEGGRGAE